MAQKIDLLQDRLYEIDKSWKNNVVLFGVPLDADSDAEEDPIVTEEKVKGNIMVVQEAQEARSMKNSSPFED